MVGGNPGIDRAANRLDRKEPSWPGLHRRSILFISQSKEARTAPLGAGDRKGDLGNSVISVDMPGKAVSHHHHPLRPPITLPDQDRAVRQFRSLLIKAGLT